MLKINRTVLIVDDDRNFCLAASDFLGSADLDVQTAHSAKDCLEILSSRPVDIILLDQRLPDAEGYTLCPSILDSNSETKIIFMTAFPSIDNAVNAVRAGAFDYLTKPFELEELELAVKQAVRVLDLEKVEQLQNYRTERDSEENVLIGGSGHMSEMKRLVGLAAKADAPVLITGETGAGKNVVARSIHLQGQSRHAPFVSINCAALPESLIEAELFGYEKGAFTGAAASRKGIFEMAEGGTLFLDEIGEMPVALQSKLLGVLDDGSYRRLGGTALLRAQVRVIAATSVDLEQAIRSRQFREDLYYRLGVIRINVVPLRERKEDMGALCSCLLSKVAKGRNIKLSDDETTRLMAYDWPGNVRELRNVLERAVILQQGPEIRPSELLGSTAVKTGHHAVEGLKRQADQGTSSKLNDIEREHIIGALGDNSGNYSRAARALGISLSTLKRRLKKYNMR